MGNPVADEHAFLRLAVDGHEAHVLPLEELLGDTAEVIAGHVGGGDAAEHLPEIQGVLRIFSRLFLHASKEAGHVLPLAAHSRDVALILQADAGTEETLRLFIREGNGFALLEGRIAGGQVLLNGDLDPAEGRVELLDVFHINHIIAIDALEAAEVIPDGGVEVRGGHLRGVAIPVGGTDLQIPPHDELALQIQLIHLGDGVTVNLEETNGIIGMIQNHEHNKVRHGLMLAGLAGGAGTGGIRADEEEGLHPVIQAVDIAIEIEGVIIRPEVGGELLPLRHELRLAFGATPALDQHGPADDDGEDQEQRNDFLQHSLSLFLIINKGFGEGVNPGKDFSAQGPADCFPRLLQLRAAAFHIMAVRADNRFRMILKKREGKGGFPVPADQAGEAALLQETGGVDLLDDRGGHELIPDVLLRLKHGIALNMGEDDRKPLIPQVIHIPEHPVLPLLKRHLEQQSAAVNRRTGDILRLADAGEIIHLGADRETREGLAGRQFHRTGEGSVPLLQKPVNRRPVGIKMRRGDDEINPLTGFLGQKGLRHLTVTAAIVNAGQNMGMKVNDRLSIILSQPEGHKIGENAGKAAKKGHSFPKIVIIEHFPGKGKWVIGRVSDRNVYGDGGSFRERTALRRRRKESRSSMTMRPQPEHFILISAPVRMTVQVSLPQG